ncbi:MAG: Ig-like domain-containing protein [Gemmatimonadetes bacterium]|nr:Ig-like domain-containing protein [Gemmatimonadota bacterium]
MPIVTAMDSHPPLARLAALLAVAAAACDSGGVDSALAPAGPAVVISPSSVTLDAVGDRRRLTASVLGADATPVPDASVTWRSDDTTIANVTEDGLVIARANGMTVVTAAWDTLVGRAEVSVAQVGVSLFKVSGDEQAGVLGQTLERPLVARVTDRFGHPVRDATVFFRIESGGGTLSEPTPHTNAEGNASTRWTLGPTDRDQTVAASLTPGALTPAIYNATARQAATASQRG